ncbi:flagellar protein FlgN [Bartonella sp. DGB2]|uniref:flagellar protein FlgN n=1 Tax=Bartonella sp. DGB2 TaxID=3388426 RepID=UPI00399009A2
MKKNPMASEFAMQKFAAAIEGLGEVVDYESDILESNGNPDYNKINARKTRGLRDLNQAMGEVSVYLNDNMEESIARLLQGLQKKLERNSDLLKIHLEAVSELSQMMQMAVRSEETDGTYDPFSVKIGHP